MLPSEIWKLPSDPPARGFPADWKLPLIRLPSRDGSPSLALLSPFFSFIFCPNSLRRQWVALLGAWCPLLAIRSCFVKFVQRSIVLSMNLKERKCSPRPIPLPSWLLLFYLFKILYQDYFHWYSCLILITLLWSDTVFITTLKGP